MRGEEFPTPALVEIRREDDGSFFLLYLDASGDCQTDTWHETLEDAKAQAKREFGVEPGEWTEVGCGAAPRDG